VFLNVSFRGLVGMVSHVSGVPPRTMRVVRRLFVMSSLVMLCRFVVVMSGMRTMFRCLFVVLGCFFRHFVSSILLTEPPRNVPTTMLVPQSTEDRGFPGRRPKPTPTCLQDIKKSRTKWPGV
jgi:hypothetical protein